jgi:hypothetical protein
LIATADDVLEGFRALWLAAGVPALVTGGIQDARKIPATVQPPVAVVKVVPGDKQTATGGLYLEKFAVHMWLHSINGTHDRDAMARLADRVNWTQALWPLNRGVCLHVKPTQPPDGASPFGNQARDVAVTAMGWEVLMQQTRG